ncbi:MAG: hypothetical protein PHQ86_02150 [Dehalococcoidales bacterium]|nr:hypothetical protein [Dehalococcoidales bacterium]
MVTTFISLLMLAAALMKSPEIPCLFLMVMNLLLVLISVMIPVITHMYSSPLPILIMVTLAVYTTYQRQAMEPAGLIYKQAATIFTP